MREHNETTMTEPLDAEQIGQAVRRRRTELRYRSQTAAAREAGVHLNVWHRLEAGKTEQPNPDTIYRIAEVLDWPADWHHRLTRGIPLTHEPAAANNGDGPTNETVDDRISRLERIILDLTDEVMRLRRNLEQNR